MRRRGRENESESQFVASSSSSRLLTLSLFSFRARTWTPPSTRSLSRAPPKESARERTNTNLFLVAPAFRRPLLDSSSLTHVPSKDRDTGEPLARVLSHVVGGFILPLPRGSLLGRSFLRPPLSQKSKIKNKKSKKTHSLTTCPRSPVQTRRTPRR